MIEKELCPKCLKKGEEIEAHIWGVDVDGELVYHCPKCGGVFRKDGKQVKGWV